VNGKPVATGSKEGYCMLRRRWKTGDSVRLALPMRLRTEPMRDDPNVVAFLYGPLVLAANLGPADVAFAGLAPGIVGEDLIHPMRPIPGRIAEFDMAEVSRPRNLRLEPFFRQYDRRTAVYFRRYAAAGWAAEEDAFAADRARMDALDAHAVDMLYLGTSEAEQAHGLVGPSETLRYRGRDSRLARKGGWFEFRMQCAEGPMTVQAMYRGDERNRRFRVLVDGVAIASERLEGARGECFFEQDYPVPVELTRGKRTVIVRFEADRDFGTGPVYACRMLRAADVSRASA
jgi:hypothetical protein